MPEDSAFVSPLLGAAGDGLYLTGEDNLRLTTWGALAGAVVALEGRFIDVKGCSVPFAETLTPNSDRSVKTQIYPAREGRLTNVQVRASSGAALTGHIGAIVEIVRGREGGVQPLGTLLQGYVTAATRLAWPGTPIRPLAEGPGRIRLIVGTNPAANAEITETVPTGARWKLRSFRFVFVAGAAVANRTPILVIDDGANTLWETGSAVAVTANQTVMYNAAPGVQFFTYASSSYHLPLPGEVILPAGARIRTVTGNLQAADDYAAPIYAVEEWIEQ